MYESEAEETNSKRRGRTVSLWREGNQDTKMASGGMHDRLGLIVKSPFMQVVRKVTELTIGETWPIVIESGIESTEDLMLFGEKDIDQLFQSPDLMKIPHIKRLRLKGLAEFLRDQRNEGIFFPIDKVTRSDIDGTLMNRAQRGIRVDTRHPR
jgi:hypothetical protein